MYQYNELDQQIVDERVRQFRDQVQRRLTGKLSEDEFRPLRLMNGLYMQRHAYMLRVAVPYGLLSSQQLRKLGYIAERYDRGFGHFTTRQNIQYNWPELEDVPDILAELASVEMHAIQTSGNCIRNITADPLAGVAADEIEDPRPYCELLRQYSTFHPEFSYLPRKFKIAVTGATQDRAAVAFHDIGVRMVKNEEGEVGYQVIVGGGLGRTPVIGEVIRPFLEKPHLLSYVEAIMRVYNLYGNRDNKYKARIKILVRELGIEEFRRQVEEEWEHFREGAMMVPEEEIARLQSFFPSPDYASDAADDRSFEAHAAENKKFARWLKNNVSAHKVPGYNVVSISLKIPGTPPGDITDQQMYALADLADQYSFGMISATHEQNLVLQDIKNADLFAVWQALEPLKLAWPNIGTLTDQICCPGLDYCSLANASSIPIAESIAQRFDDLDYLYDLGELKLKMSGCINACGHHHVGHIGILGIDKRGQEFYQIMLGGSAMDDASLGQWLGPAIARDEILGAVERLLEAYLVHREEGERFLETYRRLGPEPFKEKVYAQNH
ncbi:MAG: nitrite/sulfite reductase [Myxococcales bacterium]|nr:nitrite/sulfite reductase [Myxococcales bacterium]MCB9642315.1 nitrite/sulfite reductase [Myxococcales bacterium]